MFLTRVLSQRKFLSFSLSPASVFLSIHLSYIFEEHKGKPVAVIFCLGWGSNILLVYTMDLKILWDFTERLKWTQILCWKHSCQACLCLEELYVDESQGDQWWKCFVYVLLSLRELLKPNSNSFLFGFKITVFNDVCVLPRLKHRKKDVVLEF